MAYLNKNIILIFLLGISSGFPLALTGANLGYWMTETNVDIKTVAFFSLVGTAYSLKFLWAPLIDKVSLPIISRLLGRRKSWMLVTQIALMLSIFAVGMTDPATQLWHTALYCVALAFASASQDIVIDAYRVEILEPEDQGLGAAAITLGYRIGMLISGAGGMYMLAAGFAWPEIYRLLSVTTLFGAAVALFGPRPEIEKAPQEKKGFGEWFTDAVINPFRSFAKTEGWLAFLLFVLLFKLGDAMMSGVIMGAFYKMLGTDPATLANITKVFGLIATIIGAFVGGWLVKKLGLVKALWIGAILQTATNLLFAVLAEVGNNIPLLTFAIGADNFCGGLATTAFVALISRLCNLNYTATQYALLSSLSSVGRTVISAYGGVVITAVGWPLFFVFTAAVALPGIVLLAIITKYLRKG